MVAAEARLSDSGLETTGVDDTVCCYAEKTETWVHGPDGTRWEWYVKHADAEQLQNVVIGSRSGTRRELLPELTARADDQQRASRAAAGTEPGGVPAADGVVGRLLQHLVDRRRHAVQAAEQHDLAVEVVDLDRAARAPGSATSTRPAAAASSIGTMRRMSPRRARSSASLTWSMPAAASTASPSARASSCEARGRRRRAGTARRPGCRG